MLSLKSMISRSGRLPGCALAVALCFALAGCLQPLYGSLSEGGGDVSSKLQAIRIVPISDRAGHYLENDLRFGFNGTGAHVEPRYTLYVGLSESVRSPLVDTVTGYPTSGTVVIVANYTLTEKLTGATITKGAATVASSYDRTSQRFANVRASRDAELRDAHLLGDQIRTNIAAAFAGKS